jgi:hypothetical protein
VEDAGRDSERVLDALGGGGLVLVVVQLADQLREADGLGLDEPLDDAPAEAVLDAGKLSGRELLAPLAQRGVPPAADEVVDDRLPVRLQEALRGLPLGETEDVAPRGLLPLVVVRQPLLQPGPRFPVVVVEAVDEQVGDVVGCSDVMKQ